MEAVLHILPVLEAIAALRRGADGPAFE